MNILAFSIITRPEHLLIEPDGIEEREKERGEHAGAGGKLVHGCFRE
jgi:hypothetical protein